SLFDVDNGQKANNTATDAAGAPINISAMTLANGTSGIGIAGSNTPSATATGIAGGYADTDNRGTVNVRINGPVKSFVITLSNNAGGDIWLSDLGACITGVFPATYQKISRPFTGQPQYVLT